MNLFNDFIKLDIKKNMGLYNLTDEFFCVYLNSIREKNNNILVVVDSIFEANKIYNKDCRPLLSLSVTVWAGF